MSALARTTESDYYTRAANDDFINGGLRTRTKYAWPFEPWVAGCLGVSAAPYGVGLRRLWRQAGRGHGVSMLQASAFAAGWIVLVLALVTPLDSLGGVLFSTHMVQHALLIIVAAPLLVAGRRMALWAWGLPLPWRRAAGQFFHRPAWRVPWLIVTAPLAA